MCLRRKTLVVAMAPSSSAPPAPSLTPCSHSSAACSHSSLRVRARDVVKRRFSVIYPMSRCAPLMSSEPAACESTYESTCESTCQPSLGTKLQSQSLHSRSPPARSRHGRVRLPPLGYGLEEVGRGGQARMHVGTCTTKQSDCGRSGGMRARQRVLKDPRRAAVFNQSQQYGGHGMYSHMRPGLFQDSHSQGVDAKRSERLISTFTEGTWSGFSTVPPCSSNKPRPCT
jgi:hypothetical protein